MKIEHEENTVALLIDGDNVPSRFIDYLERRIAVLGRITHKRLYFTYNGGIPNGWEEKFNDFSLTPVMVPPHTNGAGKSVKNVADFKLSVEAMEIMYKGLNNTFVIVSSDSDFTTLIKELKENGIFVLGAGEKHTSTAFMRACNEFVYLEDLQKLYSSERAEEAGDAEENQLIEPVEEKAAENVEAEAVGKDDGSHDKPDNHADDSESSLVPKSEIDGYISSIFDSNDKEILNAGFLNLEIRKRYIGFNCKEYGCSKFTKFLNPEKFRVENQVYVKRICR